MNKISLLFLTYSDIQHIRAFSDYLENGNIYIHPKYPDKVDKTLKKYIIPSLIETKWGDKSIVNATLNLLKESFKNNDNKWFLLCSEDIFPLLTYNKLFDYLSKQSHSIFDIIDPSKNKTSQFWALKREDVSKILTNQNKWNTIMDKIPKKSATDELFFLPLLKLIDNSYQFTDLKFCYVKWFQNFVSKHPTTFNCLLQDDLTAIKTNNSCFVRKTYKHFKNTLCPEKPLTILLVYGSESITNYNLFLRDFSEIANIYILSMLDKVNNSELTNICCQTYYVVWNDLENAINEINKTFIGDVIITSEKLDVNSLKTLLENSKLHDDTDNLYRINFDLNDIKFFSGHYMLEENSNKEDKEEKEKEEEEEDSDNGKLSAPDETIEKNEEEILLKLGDILLITDPTNETLNNNIFLIEYIDPYKIKLVNGETFEKSILQISSDGVIGDGNITSIKVISSNPESGYARQNELLPGTWINIYFGGDIPSVITGKITNLEEDMIEIRTTDNDTIFINFAYQGIPEDLPIETFELRSPVEEQTPEELVELGEPTPEELEEIPTTVVKEQIKRVFFDMNDLEFGDVIKVEEFITIDKDKYRYNIESQTNDLLEEMVSTIPSYKRTNTVLNSIHIMITRFLQLREISSTFDQNKNITGIIKRTADDRPLAEYLSEFKNSLYWIMLVAKNVKKIYSDKEYKRNDDYETLNLLDELKEISSLFITRRSMGTDKTKYTNFTYQNFDKYMTPFYSINPDIVNDVFAEPNGIIVEGNVESNINAIIDNLGDLYSTIIEKSEVTNRRFIIQKYNLGSEKLHATNFKGQNLIAHRVKVTPNDPISINSIITLPEPTVRFSQVNLPGTNLLVKANLNLHFLNYWQLLKEKTSLTKITIDGLDNEIEYDDSNFVDNIKQYMLDLSEYNKPEDLTNLDIYRIFLRTIIPKIKILFSLVKKYIKGRLSLVDVVNYLEPFMIYPIDLTYTQYNQINAFIYEKIKEYNVKFKQYRELFSGLRYLKFRGASMNDKDNYVFNNPLFDILTNNNDYHFKTKIMELYDYDSPNMTISGSEFLKNITLADYGNLYNTSVAFTNIDLMFPTNLSELFDVDKNRMKDIVEKDKQNDKCFSYVIAKKYYSIDALTQDNQKIIYFDKDYDTTNYDLVEEKYKKERDQLTSEDFILFLTEQLKAKDKMDENSAEYMATTLVNQAKKVREGDYALLVVIEQGDKQADQMDYYVRNNDIWVLDKNIDPQNFINDDDVLCNINYSCIYNSTIKTENKCESTEVSKDTIIQNALKEIIEQFDKNYDISKSELNSRINTKLEYFIKHYETLEKFRSKQFFKYNNKQYEIGLSISDDINSKKISPYIKLRDLIIGQNDFIKRQNDIIKFANLYCYEGNPDIPNVNDGEMEDEWWLYCKETNTKLLPRFHVLLAYTFINNNTKYDDVLNELKRTIGKRSDDGDAWVDKHSGEVICMIDLDVSEGYIDGFIDKSRNILEKDAGDVAIETQKEKRDKRLSPEGEIVSNIVSILSTNMGINIEQSREFIINVVTNLMSDTKIIEKETSYRKRQEDAAKRGKNLPSYGTIYASTILYLSLGMYLIAIQTSIPSIKTRKTAPGCVRSFTGFPFEGEGDDSSINYVACVALKSRDTTTIPWNVLPKNEEIIVTKLKSFIIRYLLSYGEVEQKIKEKIEYLLVNPQEFIPEEHDLSKWLNFLPPLKRFHVNNLQNVTEGFIDDLQNDLSSGNYRQLDKILVIDSKIIAFSLAIQEAIQKIIEKKDLLMKSAGQFFIDNACCNEKDASSITTLGYFINDDKNIEVYNNIVFKLSSLLKDIKILTESAIMLSEIDTKRSFPILSNTFSEEIIYQSFIILCKFQSTTPLSEELESICIDKPDYIKKMDTIQEKIAKLKNDGRNYTNEQFLRLFQIVSRNNIIKMSLSNQTSNCSDNLKNLLVLFDKEDDENVPKALTQKLEDLVDVYDVMIEEDTQQMRKLKDYLQNSIEKMRNELLEFIKLKSKISSNELRNITKFIKDINVWRFDENPRNVDIKISDDSLNNYINFIKNFIELIVIVFPSMIINQKIQTIDPPQYWGLSKDHSDDVSEMVSNFYRPIEKFYGDNSIENILREIMIKSRGIYLLSQNTPVLTNIKIGNKEVYNAFDKRTTSFLYEYYLLSVLTDYIYLTNDPTMVPRLLVTPDKGASEIFSRDFLIEQELRFTTEEQEIIEGDVTKLNQEVGKLIVAYLQIMMKSKKTINVSYQDVQDKIFKLKEAEKYDFTDKLRDLTDDGRAVDTILKHYKLGPIYSLGLSKGIKEYDPEHFEHDKKIAENVARIEKKLKQKTGIVDATDFDDIVEEIGIERDIERDIAMDMNPTDDYDDGDPWGDEMDNFSEYE